MILLLGPLDHVPGQLELEDAGVDLEHIYIYIYTYDQQLLDGQSLYSHYGFQRV